MKQVFTTIQAELKAKVASLKHVTRWNNQLANEATEKLVKFPACFYQLTGLKFDTFGAGIQHGEGILRLRFCDWGLDADKLRTYDVEEAAYLALQNFSGGPLLVGLTRVNVEPDANYDSVEVLVVDYRIKYEDRARLQARRTMTPAAVVTTVSP